MILADWQIKRAIDRFQMIDPFVPEMVREIDGKRVISYGLGSYGYDMRLSNQFKVLRRPGLLSTTIDPKAFDNRIVQEIETDVLKLPPYGSALGLSVEYWKMPPDVTGICVGKSTYARSFVHVLMTPLEAGWCGRLVIEVVNVSAYPVRVYANEGIAQVIFHMGAKCDTPYDKRNGGGKYQDQREIVLSKV